MNRDSAPAWRAGHRTWRPALIVSATPHRQGVDRCEAPRAHRHQDHHRRPPRQPESVAELVELLKLHRKEQGAERETVAQLWTECGWLFATPTGGPVSPQTDYTEWKRLLVRAGIRDGRLHDARHTAATVLLLLGVPERLLSGPRAGRTVICHGDAVPAHHRQVRTDIAKQAVGCCGRRARR